MAEDERVRVTLDFTRCRYIGELYLEMRTKMEWDEDFGENFSALWDILRGMPYKGDDFTILRPRRYTEIPYDDNEGFGEYVDKIYTTFLEAQQKGILTVRMEYVDGVFDRR